LSLADRIVVLIDGLMRQIGTPEELYARPANPDVAEFMGYRNLLRGRAAGGGHGRVSVSVGEAVLEGTAVEPLADGEAIAAIRPEDLTPRDGGQIAATVTAAEFRGRDFYGSAVTADRTELFFRADRRVAPGEAVRLGVDAVRVLVYGASA